MTLPGYQLSTRILRTTLLDMKGSPKVIEELNKARRKEARGGAIGTHPLSRWYAHDETTGLDYRQGCSGDATRRPRPGAFRRQTIQRRHPNRCCRRGQRLPRPIRGPAER